MGPLIAALMSFVRSKAGQLAIGAGGAALSDVVNIDVLRREAVRIAPNSDPEALEEAARMLVRMLGLDGSNVLFPKGGPTKWMYFHMDMQNGRAWFTSRYTSRKSVSAAWSRARRVPTRVVASAGSFRQYPGGRGFST